VDDIKEETMRAVGEAEDVPDSKITPDVVAWNTARGILFGVHKAILEAKDVISSRIPLRSDDRTTEPDPRGTTGVFRDDQIQSEVQVAEDELAKFSRTDLTLMVSDLEAALNAIVSSKVWRITEPKTGHSHRQRIVYPFTTAVLALKNQLVDVPRLFTPGGRRIVSKNDECNNNGNFNASWRNQHRIAFIMFSGVVGAFYGAIHLTKWNSIWFPTQTEHRLWRISCCIGSVAVLPIGISMMLPLIPYRRSTLRMFCICLCTVLWITFGAARVYFMVESFLSIRSLPASAYATVQWANSIPHL
jgi:hypothetical protein